jgi:hypothetical protein
MAGRTHVQAWQAWLVAMILGAPAGMAAPPHAPPATVATASTVAKPARPATPAAPAAPATIKLRDLPGTGGRWYEGSAVIAAPSREVLAWLVDYAAWPRRFPDITSSQVLGDDEDGRHVVRFHSRIAGASITIHEEVRPDLLVFFGHAWFAYTQGRIWLIDRGDGTTLVLMQSTAQPRGIAKVFATRSYIRDRSFAVTRSHLSALDALARARARSLAGEAP